MHDWISYFFAAAIGVMAAGGIPRAAIAQDPEDVAPVARQDHVEETATIKESALTDSDREHWAFRRLSRPAVPRQNDTWPRGEIDAFILERLKEAAISPSDEADRGTLLRRLSFDLNGLPPSPEDLQEFAADSSPDAVERLIDRLLASPAYGECWGQHWLDLARFAETDGFEHDKLRPDAWKFRDWVIAAFNQNMPYDKFTQLQVAGDDFEDESQALATMFCLSGPDMPDTNDQFERRHLMLNEMTSTVGAVFLGLQMGCAECHDHKYDPVSQSDFYRLRAVFESAVPTLKRDAPYPQLKQQRNPLPARFWIRGDHRRAGPQVAAAFPRIASNDLAGDSPSAETNPRRALAAWLVRDENPLTSRVIVNRVWKHHLQRGLFDTPSDVGLLNSEPTHPELLDWLAMELQRHDWDLKWLHRQITASSAFRQTSRGDRNDPEWVRSHQVDPDNRLLSRGRRRRLEGESIRDAMLAASGLLSDEKGGPGVMPPLPQELVGTLLKGQWTTSPRAADHDRRSIYLFTRRNLRYPLFEVFDRPDANASCAARNRSTTPTQSLLLLNSELSLRAARHLAARVLARSREPAEQTEQLFLLTLGRSPGGDEVQRIGQFLDSERKQLEKSASPRDQLALPVGFTETDSPYAAAALVEACLAMLNASEMIYVD